MLILSKTQSRTAAFIKEITLRQMSCRLKFAPRYERVKVLKGGLRLSLNLKYSTSGRTIGEANYAVAVVTDSIRL